MSSTTGQQAHLVYDGDCRFCSSWIDYWSGLTGQQVIYSPYQKVASDYPELDEDQFRRHIQFFDEYDNRHQGAAAAFQVMLRIPGKTYWWWLYRHIPGFAAVSEWIYDRVAEHRGAAFTTQKLLWGSSIHPDHYQLVSWLFLRLLALIYLAAFVSFYIQAPGLIGEGGLLPLQDFISDSRQQSGFWHMPTLFWWWQSDLAIRVVCLTGITASLLVLVNRLLLPGLAVLYLAYLSLFYGGQEFMHYQWDLLLLEAGFLAIFLGRGRIPVVWLFRLLLFRFVFLSGAVKLLSGDPNWAGLTALHYHFATQPLPTPLAWHAHQLPDWLLHGMTLATLVIELLLPLLYFLPRRPRMLAAWSLILMQSVILLTGNYNFFNLLTLALCLFLFDDHALRWLRPLVRRGRDATAHTDRHTDRHMRKPLPLALVFLWLFSLGIVQMWLTLHRSSAPPWIYTMARVNEPWHWVNAYGLFAVMTTQRPEIVIEGSADGETWLAYELPFKPGDPHRAPGWAIPHQPRLDWQLWFAALRPQHAPHWMRPLLIHLLFNSPPVTQLLDDNPFAGEPPRYIRARLFLYEFTDPQQRAVSGAWWQRRAVGTYMAPLHLKMEVERLAPARPN